MSALDRLQNYSSRNNTVISEVFDVSTAKGCFLEKLHSKGYSMYEYIYENKSGGKISQDEYSNLSDVDKEGYERKVKYTELHDMLTTAGDQLVLANAGSGKALDNNTKVLTSKGYVEIGKLQVGDLVFGTDLQAHKVKGVFPQGKKKVNVLTVESEDSSFSFNCCDEHLWAIDSGSRAEVLSTADLKQKLKSCDNLFLVDSVPFNTDACFSAINKSCILHTFLRGRVLDIFSGSIEVTLDAKEYNRYFIDSLVSLLSNENLTVSFVGDYEDSLVYSLTYSSRFALYAKSVLCNKFTEKLLSVTIPLISTQELDALRIFNSKRCKYRVVDIVESDVETDMTCIEVDSENHLFLIEGLVPTHNTTALIFKIMLDIITNEATKVVSIPNGNKVRVVDDIFVGTFLKSGADELHERLSYWQRGLGYPITSDQVNFSTLHAEFKRALNTMGAATPIGSTADINRCMKKAIDNLGISRNGNVLSAEDYSIIGGIITYYRGRLDDKRYNHPDAYEYGLTPVVLDRLVSDFANQRQLAGIMDFEDLQELLYRFLYVTPNKAVQDFCANRYKYIYLDEFQDTSQIQYAIMKFYARGRLWMNRGIAKEDEKSSPLYTGDETLGKIVVVGDNDQCIYSWRGSDNSIIEEVFWDDFKPCRTNLSYNYRCPSNILNAVVPSIKMNKGHENREYRSQKEGGICKGYHFSTYKSMLNQLLVDIDKDMQEGNTVAVLCRTNYDGVIPAFILESSKHYDFSISGQNMTFDSPLPRKLIAVTSIFTEKSSLSVRNTLAMLVPRHAEWSIKKVTDTLKNNNKSIWQLPEADIEYSCPELAPMIKHIKSLFYDNGKRNQAKEIEALRFVYQWIKSVTFGGQSLYCESARAYIEALVYLLDNNKFESVYDFVEYVDAINERLHARVNNSKAKISIATVHEFKGKERDSVIVWNDSDGVFPSAKVDIRNQEELEGERRLHYVACTRAKKKSIVYTMYGREGIFVSEMDLKFESPQQLGGTLTKPAEKELTDDEKNLLDVMNSVSE